MRVTRNDVARVAGVSPALVSYVINNGPRPVSDQARTRVNRAIEELGYRPDGIARNLRTGKSLTMGLVVPDIALPYFGEITKLITAQAFRRGYQLLIANTDWDLEHEQQLIARLADQRVDGVILMSVEPEQDFSVLESLGIPAVVVDRPQFIVNSAIGAMEHLLAHGHERIAFLHGGSRVNVERRRVGWLNALRSAGLEAPESYIVRGGISRADGYASGPSVFALDPRPTAILVDTDALAVGLLRAARDSGVSVPEQLAIVSLEGTDLARFANPSLTSIRAPLSEIAALAVERVLELDGPIVRRVDLPDYELVLRESCGHDDSCHAPPNSSSELSASG